MQALSAAELGRLIDSLLKPTAFIELAVLAGCLIVAWSVVRALRGAVPRPGSVWFGDGVVDGLLFPVLALVLAVGARYALVGVVPIAVFRLVVPILMSLAVIRLMVRVLHAAFPASAVMRVVERSVSWVAWIAVVAWITGVLPLFMDQLDEVQWKMGNARVSLRNVVEGSLNAAIVLVVALWVSSAIESRLLRGATDNLSVRKMAANITRAMLLFVGLIFALSAAGIDLTALGVLGGALGVGIGLGLQRLAANYVSGFVILAERSVRIGDNVRVDNFEGRITDINARYTLVRALNGRESIVPNETLITSRVENLSPVRGRVGQTVVLTVNYDSDIELVERLLLDAVRDRPRVLADPAPSVALSNFGADGLEFTLSYTIDDPENGQLNLRSDINRAILNALRAHHIDIPFPQRVVRVVGQGGGEGAAFSGS